MKNFYLFAFLLLGIQWSHAQARFSYDQAGNRVKRFTSPDLTPIINLPQANFAPGASNNFTVDITEVIGAATSSGNVSIVVVGSSGYALSYDNSLTTINVSGGTANPVSVDNTKWTLTTNIINRQLYLTINSGQNIPANGTARIGFTITRTSAGSGSTSSVGTNIIDDPTFTYDSNTTNNIYYRIISAL